MSSSEPVRVGFVGCGNISGPYADTMQKHPGRLEIVGAYDIAPDAAKAFVGKYGGKLYTSLDELTADPAVEVAINLTIHLAHAEVTRKLLAAGKHVHSEKPLATTRQAGGLAFGTPCARSQVSARCTTATAPPGA